MNKPLIEVYDNINELNFVKEPLSEFKDNVLLAEVKRRRDQDDLDDEIILDKIGMEFGPEYESLQHQQLQEEFDEARKNISPLLLFDILEKINRPYLNNKVIVIR